MSEEFINNYFLIKPMNLIRGRIIIIHSPAEFGQILGGPGT